MNKEWVFYRIDGAGLRFENNMYLKRFHMQGIGVRLAVDDAEALFTSTSASVKRRKEYAALIAQALKDVFNQCYEYATNGPNIIDFYRG